VIVLAEMAKDSQWGWLVLVVFAMVVYVPPLVIAQLKKPVDEVEETEEKNR
jgi:hypothetical protein